MQKVTFDVVSRPTKEAVGVTNVNNVTFDENGAVAETILIGTVTTARGSGTYQATLNKDGNATALDGDFTSRSKAGHAIQRAYFADVRAAKEAARAAKAEADAQARAEAKLAREKARAEKAQAREQEKAAKAAARAAAKAAKEAAKAAEVESEGESQDEG